MKTCLNCNKSFPNKYQNCPYCGSKVGTIEQNDMELSMYFAMKLKQLLLPIIALLVGIMVFNFGLWAFNRIVVVIGVLIIVSTIAYIITDFLCLDFVRSIPVVAAIALIVSIYMIFTKLPFSDIPEKVATKCLGSSYGENKGVIAEKDKYGRMLIKYNTSKKGEVYIIIQSYKDDTIYVDENAYYEGEKIYNANTTKGYEINGGGTTFIYKSGSKGDLANFKSNNNWNKPIKGSKKVPNITKK